MTRLTPSTPRRAAGLLLAVLACALVPAGAALASRRSAATVAPLVFGIYPGGGAGTVSGSGGSGSSTPASALGPLEQLRARGRPFVLHIYSSYTGPGAMSAAVALGPTIARYTRAGFQVELVLTYRPADRSPAADVPGFVAWVQQAVHDLDGNRRVVSFQVTNEPNLPGQPDASDGDYPGVEDALIQGVIAAKAQSRADAASQVKVGFNWAYDGRPFEAAFWSYLGAHGGPAFLASLDWVGVDAYPGTWGPSVRAASSPSVAVRRWLGGALYALRSGYMPLAGIPPSVPIHISETGFPTGPGHSNAMQVTTLRAVVSTVRSVRVADNVTQLCWFDLRDADSASSSVEQRYGLMSDRYRPKPAFRAYRALVARGG